MSNEHWTIFAWQEVTGSNPVHAQTSSQSESSIRILLRYLWRSAFADARTLTSCASLRKSRRVSCGFTILPNAGVRCGPTTAPPGSNRESPRIGVHKRTCIFCASKFSQNPLYGLAQSLTLGGFAHFYCRKTSIKRNTKVLLCSF